MRVLVLANETCASQAVVREVRAIAGRADQPMEVMVIAPALAESRLAHWTGSRRAKAIAEADVRLRQSVRALIAVGIPTTGVLGDADPLQALDDGMRIFRPDAVVIATHPADRSKWQERWVVDRARERYETPITHVVVDLEAERAGSRDSGMVDRPRPTGVPEATESVRLHAHADYEGAMTISRGGFRDSSEHGRMGVLTRDRPAQEKVAAVFAVDIPADAAAPFEIDPDGDGARRFVVPAALLNVHGPAQRLDVDALE